MFFVWIRRTSRRPVASGIPISISLSNRPKRRSAASMELGLLVAAMTMTCELCFRPSISVNSCETIRRSTSPWVCRTKKWEVKKYNSILDDDRAHWEGERSWKSEMVLQDLFSQLAWISLYGEEKSEKVGWNNNRSWSLLEPYTWWGSLRMNTLAGSVYSNWWPTPAWLWCLGQVNMHSVCLVWCRRVVAFSSRIRLVVSLTNEGLWIFQQSRDDLLKSAHQALTVQVGW